MTETETKRIRNESTTPAMLQFKNIKDKHPDFLIFFRMGDFYELFYEDAEVASRELGITLTSRDKEKAIPMAGVPYHSVQSYINKLIAKKYKVVVVEQIKNKDNPLLIERVINKIITPGTNTYLDQEDEQESVLFALHIDENERINLSGLDINVGEIKNFKIKELQDIVGILENQFAKELLVSKSNYNLALNLLQNTSNFLITTLEDEYFTDSTNNSSTISALIKYLKHNQKIDKIEYIRSSSEKDIADSSFQLDYSTIKNLEIINGLNNSSSLYNEINFCKTVSGKKMLKEWLLNPLRNLEKIKERQIHIKYFTSLGSDTWNVLNKYLSLSSDLFKISSKISLGSATPKDIKNISSTIENNMMILKEIKNHKGINEIEENVTDFLKNYELLLNKLLNIKIEIDKVLSDDATASIKSGNNINLGISQELDNLKSIKNNSSKWLNNFEISEKNKLGIKNLKVKFNKVFGYFIEIPKNFADKIDNKIYTRKQTLVNTERYITSELKYQENLILNADNSIIDLETEIFETLLFKTKKYICLLQKLGRLTALIDIYVNHSYWSKKNRTTTPSINLEGKIEITAGYHPTIASSLMRRNKAFVPNDVFFDKENLIHVITGPNMGGKSTYMRQVGIVCLMGLCGLNVPAMKANLPLLDNIYTRVGASDNISDGDSTFMVEMKEASHILRKSTPKSLVILDEIGRGTGTFDGISIAWGILEHLSKRKIKTLFATHYLELTKAESVFENVKNYTIEIEESGKDIIFLYKIKLGKADKSYGIHVAKLAGLPQDVTKKAEKILEHLEKNTQLLSSKPVSLF